MISEIANHLEQNKIALTRIVHFLSTNTIKSCLLDIVFSQNTFLAILSIVTIYFLLLNI